MVRAAVHWFVLAPGTMLTCAGVALSAANTSVTAQAVGVIFVIFGVVSLANALITKFSTDLAVTSARVIAKRGILRMDAVELNHANVESIGIQQTWTGELFDYGSIYINGIGGVQASFNGIGSPLVFRRHALEVIETSS